MPWTDEQIVKLKAFVDASRWFRVMYHGDRVYDIDERKPEHGGIGWAAYYLSKWHCDPMEIDKTEPEDFVVNALVPLVNWQTTEVSNPAPWDGYDMPETELAEQIQDRERRRAIFIVEAQKSKVFLHDEVGQEVHFDEIIKRIKGE